MTETWKPVHGYEGLYEVSDQGSVRSLGDRWGRLRLLKTASDYSGYPMVPLTKHGRRTSKTVHRLVAEAFHPERRNVLHCEVAHLDGNRANACAANLKWVSKIENHSHKRMHGTHQAGEKHPRARLTEGDVIAIRHASVPYRILAERFGVSWHTISDIKRGKRWTGAVHESAVGNAETPNPDLGATQP